MTSSRWSEPLTQTETKGGTQMELSACIVVYNGAGEAIRAAQTVLDCTRRYPLTLYLVDNASPDGSGQQLTAAAKDGTLRTVPGQTVQVLCRLENGGFGMVGTVPIHLLHEDAGEKVPSFDELLIDVGAADKQTAEAIAPVGSFAYFSESYVAFGDGKICAKALDDRIGCMLMIELLQSELEADTWFCFQVQEEVGLRGAACTGSRVQPDRVLVLEATTAADLDGVTGDKRVCVLGDGPVVSFMDGATIYDRALYRMARETADENGIPSQTKTAIAGGNDAGALQRAGQGSAALAVSLPCRYIHSGASVVQQSDIDATRALLAALLPKLYD